MEKIEIKVVVDGKELEPIIMGEGKEGYVYKNDIVFYSMGHIHNKDKTVALYEYNISIRRLKKDKE